MKLVKAVWGYGLIIAIYVAMLLLVDTQKGFFEYAPMALAQLPVLMVLALVSYALRYLRWYLLLRWSDRVTPVWRGWLAYVSGFAFTATPGKVGELVRIRYFGRLHVDPSLVMSAFVYERALDLVVVLCLASLWVVDQEMLFLAAAFVCLFLLAVGWVMFKPGWLGALASFFAAKGWLRLARLLHLAADGLVGCRVWLKPWPLLVSFLLGVGAWSVTAFAFVYLLNALKLDVPLLAAFSVYPLAMLAGAASMLPGGVGSTEAAIVVQLQWHGVPVATALLAAVVVRMGTMWFSVVCGLVATLIQEIQWTRRVAA
jgi:uncharacterized membrane protein YbhN (UPF0104 family)